MVMEKYYTQNQLHEMCNQIYSLHLGYLKLDESREKLEERNKLEDCIHRFLCVAPHAYKFACPETARVLQLSASNNRNLSGYRAALGWEAISRYAGNLLAQSWRKEYHQIKMYSGYYKHEIESNLEGAKSMFGVMGYRQTENETLKLEGPICPDRVTAVSKDAIIAYVECQIMKAIWEEVSLIFKISWLDVLRFREQHIGDAKTSISTLISIYRQKQYQQVHGYPIDHHICNGHGMIPSPLYPMATMPAMPPNCMYLNNGCCGTPYPYPMQYPVHQPPCNPHYLPNNCVPMKPYSQLKPVPTAQLIELDQSEVAIQVNRTYDTVDRPKFEPKNEPKLSKKMQEVYINDPKDIKSAKSSERDDGSGTFETWDYVYRDLKNQGYSKDLGERPDVLTQTAEPQRASTLARPTAKEKKIPSASSLYDNVIPDVKKKIVATAGIVTTKREIKPDKPNNGWHCVTCTFLNQTDNRICEMCGKSREPVKEITVGGPECIKCTYVNSKDKKICEICGTSLDNSPTYI